MTKWKTGKPPPPQKTAHQMKKKEKDISQQEKDNLYFNLPNL